MDITSLYRDIAKTYREMGADKIVLVKSQNYSEMSGCEMSMDIVLDGDIIREDIAKVTKQKWDFIQMNIQYLADDPTGQLMEEMVYDGIWL